MHARLPRLTFLVRFALVTFASAAVAAVVLAFVLDSLHRRTLESDETRDAVARVESVFTPLVDRLAHGTVAQSELARAERDADVFNYVTGVRLYDERGNAVFPASASAQPGPVRRAVAREEAFVTGTGAMRVAYAPLATSDGARA